MSVSESAYPMEHAAGPTRRRHDETLLSLCYSRPVIIWLVRAGDVTVVAVTGYLAAFLRFEVAELAVPELVAATHVTAVLFGIMFFSWLVPYSIDQISDLHRQLQRVVLAWTAAVASVLATLYAFKFGDEVSRIWVGLWWLLGFVALIAWRIAVKVRVSAAQRSGRLIRNIVLTGRSDLLSHAAARLSRSGGTERVLAVLPIGGLEQSPTDPAPQGVDLDEVVRVLQNNDVDQVIVALPPHEADEIERVLRLLRNYSVEAQLYPYIWNTKLPQLGVRQLWELHLVQILERPLRIEQQITKSLSDRVLGSVLLALFALPMLLIALMVRLSSPGPVLFQQLRHGFNHEPIEVLKFRTMYIDQCDSPASNVIMQATKNDPRVTPIGRFLRRTSLDELPQLFNVLRGDMSLVGPRPHALAHNFHYATRIDNYLSRHKVKPGITGWAQIHGCRGETRTLEEMRRRVEYDLEYIEKWSLRLDLQILLLTSIAPFRQAKAY